MNLKTEYENNGDYETANLITEDNTIALYSESIIELKYKLIKKIKDYYVFMLNENHILIGKFTEKNKFGKRLFQVIRAKSKVYL